MATIFYNYLPGTEKLATTITDKSPQELVEEGVIPKGVPYLVMPDCHKDMDEEEQLKYREIEYTSKVAIIFHNDGYWRISTDIVDAELYGDSNKSGIFELVTNNIKIFDVIGLRTLGKCNCRTHAILGASRIAFGNWLRNPRSVNRK